MGTDTGVVDEDGVGIVIGVVDDDGFAAENRVEDGVGLSAGTVCATPASAFIIVEEGNVIATLGCTPVTLDMLLGTASTVGSFESPATDANVDSFVG